MNCDFTKLINDDYLKTDAKVTIKNKTYTGFIISTRIDSNTVPDKYYGYYLGDFDWEDADGNPFICIGEIKNGVIDIHYHGMFYTEEKLPLDVNESFTFEQGLDVEFL